MTGEVKLLNTSDTCIPISKNQFLCAYITEPEAVVWLGGVDYRCMNVKSNKELGVTLLQFADCNVEQKDWFRFSDDKEPVRVSFTASLGSGCFRPLFAPVTIKEHFFMGMERHVLKERGFDRGAVLDKKGKLTGICVPSGNGDSHYVPIFLVKSYIRRR